MSFHSQFSFYLRNDTQHLAISSKQNAHFLIFLLFFSFRHGSSVISLSTPLPHQLKAKKCVFWSHLSYVFQVRAGHHARLGKQLYRNLFFWGGRLVRCVCRYNFTVADTFTHVSGVTLLPQTDPNCHISNPAPAAR